MTRWLGRQDWRRCRPRRPLNELAHERFDIHRHRDPNQKAPMRGAFWFGWGARIRTWDHGARTRCLTAWPRPIGTSASPGRALRVKPRFYHNNAFLCRELTPPVGRLAPGFHFPTVLRYLWV